MPQESQRSLAGGLHALQALELPTSTSLHLYTLDYPRFLVLEFKYPRSFLLLFPHGVVAPHPLAGPEARWSSVHWACDVEWWSAMRGRDVKCHRKVDIPRLGLRGLARACAGLRKLARSSQQGDCGLTRRVLWRNQWRQRAQETVWMNTSAPLCFRIPDKPLPWIFDFTLAAKVDVRVSMQAVNQLMSIAETSILVRLP